MIDRVLSSSSFGVIGRKNTAFLTAVFVCIFAFTSQTFARTVQTTVKANRTTTVFQFNLFDSDTCGAGGNPKIKIIQPKNGKLATRIGRNKMDSGSCKGRTVKGVVVTYRPNSGYRGKDRGTVRFSFPRFDDDSGVRIFDANFMITVK